MDTIFLLKKLNDWAGKKGIDYLSEDTGLSACFKWLVPKAGHVKLEHVICIDPMGFPKEDYQKPYDFISEHYFDKVSPRYHWYRADILWVNEHLIGEAEIPALALCLAILKLIEKDIDKEPKLFYEEKKMSNEGNIIRIERTFETGYIRPLDRGIVLGKPGEYLDEIIQDTLYADDYSYSGGSTLTNIHIIIEIEKVK